jgi:hypothetical protein
MTETKDEIVNVEDDPAFSTYWTAIPEAMRGVVGDPIGDPISVEEFREAVEQSLAEIESYVEWHDESTLSDVVGFIVTDGAEATASGLAMDFKAAAIYVHDESGDYFVCGSNVNSDCSPQGGFFPWVLVVTGEDEDEGGDDYHSDADSGTDYSVSDDAARWSPRTRQDS